MSTAEKRRYSVAEYLKFERASELKHEYYRGEIRQMAGSNYRHCLINGNVACSLISQCRFRPYDVLMSQMRTKVIATGLYTYPDVVVAPFPCQLEDEAQDTLLDPILIVEVLSESTEAYDRRQKFAHYRTIESFQEYVLVSQNEYRVEVFTRQNDGQWLLSEAVGREANILFRTIDCRLNLEDIYRRVEIPEPGQDQTNV